MKTSPRSQIPWLPDSELVGRRSFAHRKTWLNPLKRFCSEVRKMIWEVMCPTAFETSVSPVTVNKKFKTWINSDAFQRQGIPKLLPIHSTPNTYRCEPAKTYSLDTSAVLIITKHPGLCIYQRCSAPTRNRFDHTAQDSPMRSIGEATHPWSAHWMFEGVIALHQLG